MLKFKFTKNQSYPFWGSLRYRFRKGITLNISLTYRCYLNEKTCPECSMRFWGPLKNLKEGSLEEWKEYIETFPNKIKEIYLSGGSPEMLPCFVQLCNWLLDRGYLVKVFSNLQSSIVYNVRKSNNFSIQSTYHHGANKDIFLRNYNIIRNKHWVDVDEIDYAVFPFSRVKPCSIPDDLKETGYIISPNMRCYKSCYEHYISNLDNEN